MILVCNLSKAGMIVKVHAHIAGATKSVLFHHDFSHVFIGNEMDSLIGLSTNLNDKPVTP